MNAHNETGARLRRLLPSSLEEAVPAVGVARRYDRSFLRPDLIAGAILAVVAVPSSLAMGELAGLPVVFGLYATFLPLVGYAVFGSSRQLIVGPDATMATLTAAVVAPLRRLPPARVRVGRPTHGCPYHQPARRVLRRHRS
jgi:MFS superfamily sulfate permease-like transporter